MPATTSLMCALLLAHLCCDPCKAFRAKPAWLPQLNTQLSTPCTMGYCNITLTSVEMFMCAQTGSCNAAQKQACVACADI